MCISDAYDGDWFDANVLREPGSRHRTDAVSGGGADGKYGMDTDYWSTASMETLYNEAVYIVVGKFANVAPTSYNVSRNVLSPEKESDTSYYERLIYRFEVEAVLKGDISEDVINIGISHGLKVGECVYPVETFASPDAESYKVMFLYQSKYDDHYYPCTPTWWLSTEAIETHGAQTWTELDFYVESAMELPVQRELDMVPAGESAATYGRNMRTSYTGAELLGLAE